LHNAELPLLPVDLCENDYAGLLLTNGEVRSHDGYYDNVEAYGGYLVAGCVPPVAMPLILRAPRLEAENRELVEALDTLTLVVGLTPLAGNKEAMQEAMNAARAVIAKYKGAA
jgi:hypothetical protein